MPKSVQEVINNLDNYLEMIDQFAPSPENEVDAETFRQLREAALERIDLEKRIATLVNQARGNNFSWNFIGIILGTSGEAARQRYGALVKKKPKKSA
jgi:hypothetical protein